MFDAGGERWGEMAMQFAHRSAPFADLAAMAVLGVLAALSAPARCAPSYDPANATIVQLHAALDAGRLSSETLVRFYLDRIARLDKQGPRINAIITLNPQALDRARELDAGARKMPHRPYLYGIPFVVKDNYDTAGLVTSGGSAALKSSVPRDTAFVVQRLLDQGAILIGKANMSELAASYGRLGYSSAGGLTLNPYNLSRDVSGSSSGSAAAVAADFAAFALGTDTAGSVRGPASVAGLVGLRPTLGLMSRSGVIPLSLSFDQTGVLTRSVEDMAIVLDAVAAPDPEDAATMRRMSTRLPPVPLPSTPWPPERPTSKPSRAVRPPPTQESYIDSLMAASLKGARLGVVSNFRGGNPEVDAVERAALQRLQALGAVLVPLALPREFENLWKSTLEPVGEAEFKPEFERYLATLAPNQPKTLADLIRISESPTIMASELPVNPPRLEALRRANATRLTDSPTYIEILTTVIPGMRGQLQSLMSAEDLQALVFATMSCPASPRFDRDDNTYVCASDDSYKAAYIAAAAGFPEITVPAGRISANMPVGYSFMGLPYTEALLLGLAAAFERATPRSPPPPLGPPQ